MAFYSAFWGQAYWNQGYQVARNGAEPPEDDIVGDSWIQYDPSAQRAMAENKRAKERQRIKEEEITRLRLEAQEVLVKKSEVKDDTSKQALRQIRALEREYAVLMDELQQQLVALDKLQQETVKRRKIMILLLMAAGNPFSRFN